MPTISLAESDNVFQLGNVYMTGGPSCNPCQVDVIVNLIVPPFNDEGNIRIIIVAINCCSYLNLVFTSKPKTSQLILEI